MKPILSSLPRDTTVDTVTAKAFLTRSRRLLLLGMLCIAATALVAPIAQAAPLGYSDVTTPGDAIVNIKSDGSTADQSGNPDEGADKAIDNTTSKFLFNNLGGGFRVTPSLNNTVLKGLRLYTANDTIARDPTSYTLRGSNDGSTFTTISSGALALPDARNASGIAITAANTDTLTHYDVFFNNTTSYNSYQLFFPTVKNSNASFGVSQIGEIELLTTPEPSTYAMMALGLVALCVLGAKRKKDEQAI